LIMASCWPRNRSKPNTSRSTPSGVRSPEPTRPPCCQGIFSLCAASIHEERCKTPCARSPSAGCRERPSRSD
jgi:hypothetical protein